MRSIRILGIAFPKTGAHSMHDLRVCPYCGHLVDRWSVNAAKRWHRDNDRSSEPPEPLVDPGGYVVGGPGWNVSQITGGEASE